jgi:hypothetical protein
MTNGSSFDIFNAPLCVFFRERRSRDDTRVSVDNMKLSDLVYEIIEGRIYAVLLMDTLTQLEPDSPDKEAEYVTADVTILADHICSIAATTEEVQLM